MSKCDFIILVSVRSILSYKGTISLLGAVTAIFMSSLGSKFEITEFY
jgi:hypothetical protein